MAYAICNYVTLYYVLYVIQATACVVSLFGSIIIGGDAMYWCYAVLIVVNTLHVIFVFLPNSANYDNPSRGINLNFVEQGIIIATDAMIVGSLTILAITSSVGGMSVGIVVTGSCASLSSYLALLCLLYFANAFRDRLMPGPMSVSA
jgi:hypothetical protein